jgi:DNA-damage-inducible protein D
MKNDLIHAMTESFEGQSVDNHCVDVNTMVELGPVSEREISDITLTRCACYLIAQNSFMKAQWRVPDKRPVADFAPAIILKEKDFTNQVSIHNAREQKMQSKPQKSQVHVTNKKALRKVLLGRGLRLEGLSPAEDAKKMERSLISVEKKAIEIPMGWMNNER